MKEKKFGTSENTKQQPTQTHGKLRALHPTGSRLNGSLSTIIWWVGVRAWVTLVVHFATHRIDGDVDGSRYDA
jgi:hypothetical protein